MNRKSLQDKSTEIVPSFYEYKDKSQWLLLGLYSSLGLFMIVVSLLIHKFDLIGQGIGIMISSILLISLSYVDYRVDFPSRKEKKDLP